MFFNYIRNQLKLKAFSSYNKIIVRRGGQWLSSGLENRRPIGVAGSTPVPSASIKMESWQSGNAADC